jgi:protein-tyrosine phosphatase
MHLFFNQTLQLLRTASAVGVTDVVLAPDIPYGERTPSWKTILSYVQLLQEKANGDGIPIQLYAGANMALDSSIWEFLHEGNTDYCVNNGHYVLVSLDTSLVDISRSEMILYEVMLKGFIPIIVHPERVPFFVKHPKQVLKLMHRGVLIQCDIDSFMGMRGQRICKTVVAFAKRHMVTCLGSGLSCRKGNYPEAAQAKKAIADIDSTGDVWDACMVYGESVLHDKIFYPFLPAYWEIQHSALFF